MDFLDPKKLRAHQIRLMIGYAMVATAIVLAAILLLYQAKGFGVRQGKVIQNGLVFVNSAPGAASIAMNGQSRGTTDARLVMEAGSYVMKLSRDGYRDWQRALTVEGGSVEHFSYPWLIPSQLQTSAVNTYPAPPSLVTQSPDRRWLLVGTGQIGSFDLYDIRDPQRVQAARTGLTIPQSVYGLQTDGTRSLEVVDWSNDNDHLVLRHVAADSAEYLLLSRSQPASSRNLTRELGLTPTQRLSLADKKYDSYFIHDLAGQTLSTASLEDPQSNALLTGVVAYKTYGSDVVLYTSPISGRTDRVNVRLFQGGKQYNLRTMAAAETYSLGLSRYDGAWLAVIADASEGRTYVYRNAAAALDREPDRAAVPAAVLKLAQPTNVAFSANSQLVLAQSGTNFAVYDAEYDRSHTYRMDRPLDQPQVKATWLDSHHLHYVSNGRAIVFDYDGTNLQELAPQNPGLPPVYNTGYTYVYTLAKPAAQGAVPDAHVLSATALRTANDL